MSRCFSSKRHVPMMMQLGSLESGAVSLAMVLASYGRWIPLTQMRIKCGVSRDGCKPEYVLNAARGEGMIAKMEDVPLAQLSDVPTPAILIVGADDYCVMTHISRKGKVHINSPLRGQTTTSLEYLGHSYTGKVITMHPGEDFKKEGHAPSVLRFMHEHLKNAVQPLLLTFLTGLLLMFANIVIPLMSQIYADNILTDYNPEWATPFFFAFASVVIFQFIVHLIVYIYIRSLKIQLAAQACSEFMWHMLRLPMEFYSHRNMGDLLLRGKEAGSIPRLMIQYLTPMLTDFFLLLIYLFIMMQYNVVMSLVAIVTILLNMLMIRFISNRQLNLERAVKSDNGRWQNTTLSCLNSIETIKAAGAEDSFFQRWAGHFALFQHSSTKQSVFLTYANIIPQLLSMLSMVFILCQGAYYILDGSITVGMLLAFQGYMSAFILPMQNMTTSYQNILTMRTDIERIDDIYSVKPDVDTSIEDKVLAEREKLIGKVELRNITFGYNVALPPILKGFNMTLEPGHSVAFVGDSGCGKSTLAKLISGLYEPWEGEVLFDGKKKKDIARSIFVSSVAVVDQNIVLWDGTISENIKLWDESIEDFVMILAARDAQIHDEIVSRSGAYESQLTDNGKNLSGGQRQRLEIATALAKEPTIMIMDEATSALDAKSEGLLMQAIKKLGVSLIIIAHRLSTIRDCDEIIVMEQGRVVERGNHEKLMENVGGKYYNLMQNA